MTRRTSTRLQQTASGSTLKDIGLESEQENSEDDYVEKSPKKRKATGPINGVKTTQTKKLRGIREILRKVLELPLDVIFEIFGRLAPLDLWHLAQTCKELRALLMSRSSTSIWREARHVNYPEAPDCPSDLSEPQYAVLLFGKHCFACLRKFNTIHTLWDARVRLCTNCANKACGIAVSSDIPELSAGPLSKWIPTIELVKRNHFRRCFHYPTINLWNRQYRSCSDEIERNAWLSETIKEREKIAEHAQACRAWYTSLQYEIRIQIRNVIEQREEAVIAHVKKLGWEDELIKSPDAVNYFLEESDAVSKACQKNITERALAKLDDYINTFMNETRSKRLEDDREFLLATRLPLLKHTHAGIVSRLSPNSLYPSAGQLFYMPMVYDLIVDEEITNVFTKKHLDPIVQKFPELVSQWKEETKEKLLKVIADAYAPGHVIDEDRILDLATTFFSCRRCNKGLYTYPDVFSHACLRLPPDSAIDEEPSADARMCRTLLGEGTWNQRRCIEFYPERAKWAGDIVKLCGFNLRRTMQQMNDADPILECLSCHSVYKGRATMSWMGAVLHRYFTHASGAKGSGGKCVLLKITDKREAAFIRQELANRRERRQAKELSTFCAICYQIGSTVALKRHFRQNHGRDGTSEDMLPLASYIFPPDIYRMWPARDEEELKQVIQASGTEIA